MDPACAGMTDMTILKIVIPDLIGDPFSIFSSAYFMVHLMVPAFGE
jgi:hypothetical protein